jgi:hypothetical protein
MGVIPMENRILVNFLYRFNMLLTEAGGGGAVIYSNKTKVHTLSIKFSVNIR